MADYRRVKFEKAIKKDYFNAVIEKDYEDYNQLSSAEYISMQANDITELCQNYLSPLKDINKLIIFVAHNMNQYKDVFDQVYYLKCKFRFDGARFPIGIVHSSRTVAHRFRKNGAPFFCLIYDESVVMKGD